MSGDDERPPLGVLGRTLWLLGTLAAVVGLAFLVARPRADPPRVAVNYAAVKEARGSGLEIFLRRGPEQRVLAPGTPVRAGDALRFVVRVIDARYLVVRARDGVGRDRILFPEGARTAGLVQPGQSLPGALVLDGAPGKATISALFSRRPFDVDDRAPGDAEMVTIDLAKE